MEFEYDPNKSEANKQKHGIDFEEAKALFDQVGIIIPAKSENEERWMLIAYLGKRCYSAIFTHRGERIRFISVRRCRKKEERLYDEKHKS